LPRSACARPFPYTTLFRSPTEVEVLLGGREPIVERPDTVPHLFRHQHGARRDVQDLPDPVVLALVDLSLFERRVRVSETVCGQADRKSTRLNSSHEWISYA